MTLQQLRYFLAVAKYKSLSEAARQVYVSQPALSKQISLLEKTLTKRLLVRSPQGMTLTTEGERLLEKCKPLVQQLDNLLLEFTEPGEIKIGLLPTVASYYFPQIMRRLEKYQISTFVNGRSSNLISKLDNHELNLAVVQDIPEVKGLKSKYLFEEKFVLALPEESKKNPLPDETACIHPYLEETWYLPLPECDTHHLIMNTFRNVYRLEPQTKHVPYDSLLGYVAGGRGIALIPQIHAQHIRYKGVIYQKIENNPFKRKIYMYARQETLLLYASGSLAPEKEYNVI